MLSSVSLLLLAHDENLNPNSLHTEVILVAWCSRGDECTSKSLTFYQTANLPRYRNSNVDRFFHSKGGGDRWETVGGEETDLLRSKTFQVF